MDFEVLKQKLQIDKHNLDEELIQQPFLFQEVAEQLSEANSCRDSLRNCIKETEAELDQDIRLEAKENGEKITEKVVTARIEADETYLKVKKEYLEACLTSDKLQGLKEAFMQRSYVLKDLCSLQMAGYYERDFVVNTGTNKERSESIKKEMSSKRKNIRDRRKEHAEK